MDSNKLEWKYDDIPFSIFDARGNVQNHFLHYHDFLEINYVLDGTGINCIEDVQYNMRPGDIYIINNHERHFAVAQQSLKMKIIVFDPDFIEHHFADNYLYIQPFYMQNLPFGNKIIFPEKEQEEFTRIVGVLEKEYKEKSVGYQLMIRAALMELLTLIYRFANTDVSEKKIRKEQQSYDKIRSAIDYIQENYEQDMTLDILAGLSCMSKSYFSAYFKKNMAMTVSEYIQLVRVNRAMLLLGTSDIPVTEICYQCGYRNISSFNVTFKKVTGMSPRSYRKKMIS